MCVQLHSIVGNENNPVLTIARVKSVGFLFFYFFLFFFFLSCDHGKSRAEKTDMSGPRSRTSICSTGTSNQPILSQSTPYLDYLPINVGWSAAELG